MSIELLNRFLFAVCFAHSRRTISARNMYTISTRKLLAIDNECCMTAPAACQAVNPTDSASVTRAHRPLSAIRRSPYFTIYDVGPYFTFDDNAAGALLGNTILRAVGPGPTRMDVEALH